MLLNEERPMDFSRSEAAHQPPHHHRHRDQPPEAAKGLDLSNSVLEKVCQKIMRKV